MKLSNIVCLVLMVFSVLSYADDSELNKKISNCNQMVKDGNSEKALEESAILLKKNQNNRELVLCKARAQMSLEQFADAVPTLNTVLKLSSAPNEQMMALAMLGNAYKGNQQFNEAATQYQLSMDIAKAQKNKSFERITYGLLGELQILSNQLDEAVSNYQSSLKLSFNDNERADAFEHMAYIYNKQQKHDQAIEYQLKATLAYTHYGDLDAQANAGLELGRIYMEAGDLAQAERSINKILKLAVDNGGAYWEAKSNLYLAKLKITSKQDPDAYIKATQRINKDLQDSSLQDELNKLQGMLSK